FTRQATKLVEKSAATRARQAPERRGADGDARFGHFASEQDRRQPLETLRQLGGLLLGSVPCQVNADTLRPQHGAPRLLTLVTRCGARAVGRCRRYLPRGDPTCP